MQAQPTTNGTSHDALRFTVPSANGANGVAEPSANGNNGRDTRGRFAKGNAGGPGNPFARRIAAFRRALCSTVKEEDIELIARQLLEQAKQGDLAAAKLLLAYAIGRPAESVDPDTLDQREWDQYQQTPITASDLANILQSLPASTACAIVRTAWPLLATEHATSLIEELQADPDENEEEAGDGEPDPESSNSMATSGPAIFD